MGPAIVSGSQRAGLFGGCPILLLVSGAVNEMKVCIAVASGKNILPR